jgi:hypothetical protein
MHRVAECGHASDRLGMRVHFTGAMAVCLASAAFASTQLAEIHLADLLLVRARLIACPDRLRLVEVVRVGPQPVDILDLGPFRATGRTAADLVREVRADYRRRVRGSEIPPIEIGVLSRADAREEALLLMQALDELECGEPFEHRRPDRLSDPRFERIAAR